MGQIDITPTPEAYIRMLKILLQSAAHKDEQAWIIQELKKYELAGYVI